MQHNSGLARLRRLCVTTTAMAMGASILLVPTHSATAAAPAGEKPSPTDSTYDVARGVTRDAEAAAILAELTASLPADWHSRLRLAQAESGVGEETTDQVQAAINPEDYSCGPTSLDSYVSRILRNVPSRKLYALGAAGVFSFPAFDAIYLGKPRDYRLGGKQGRKLNKSFTDLQGFWDTRSKDIDLMGMQPKLVVNQDRVAEVARVIFRAKPRQAKRFAKAVVRVVKSVPSLKKGRNPIFSLNALAFTGEGAKSKRVRRISDRIVMGGGILTAYKKLGYRKVGGKAILAHEYGHHVQFERNLIKSSLPKVEAGRRVELMADSLSSYYLGHRKGANLRAGLEADAVASFKLIGDCVFDEVGHHGTPNQRAAASTFGFDLADASGKRIKKSRNVAKAFDAELPDLVAPDAP